MSERLNLLNIFELITRSHGGAHAFRTSLKRAPSQKSASATPPHFTSRPRTCPTRAPRRWSVAHASDARVSAREAPSHARTRRLRPRHHFSASSTLTRRTRARVAFARASSDDGVASDVVGVVVVDHGSRRAASNEQLERFAALYATATGRAVVEPAHMELAPPTIADAFERCVERGANVVVVAPFFLSPGRHWQEDIPRLVDEAAAAHPGVKYLISAPIGLHPLMAEVIDSRLRHCLAYVNEGGPECDVCAGSKFGCELRRTS